MSYKYSGWFGPLAVFRLEMEAIIGSKEVVTITGFPPDENGNLRVHVLMQELQPTSRLILRKKK